MQTYRIGGIGHTVPLIQGEAFFVTNAEELNLAVAALSTRCTVTLYVTHGEAVWVNGDEQIPLLVGDLLIHNMSHSAAHLIPNTNFEMQAVCVSSEFDRQFAQLVKISWNIRKVLKTNALFHLSPNDRRLWADNYQFLLTKSHETDYPQREIILKNLLHVLSVEMLLHLEQYITDPLPDKSTSAEKLTMGNATSAQLIFGRFSYLLEKTIIKNRPVSWWAEQLNITPKYLTAVCRAVEGRSARCLIADAIIQDANLYMQDSHLTIKEVSERLGFANQSHFGTFYKRHTGHSPMCRNQE